MSKSVKAYSIVHLYLLHSNGTSEQHFCKEYNACYGPDYTLCPALPSSRHSHIECRREYVTLDGHKQWFHCLNRSDRRNVIFEKSLSQTRSTGIKLSTNLHYTENFFHCTNDLTFNWTRNNLKKVRDYFCILDNGLHIAGADLVRLLVIDQSFSGKELAPIDKLLTQQLEENPL